MEERRIEGKGRERIWEIRRRGKLEKVKDLESERRKFVEIESESDSWRRKD